MPSPLLEFDIPQSTVPSTAVVDCVAAVSDCHIEELPLLAEAVDPDALDELCARQWTGKVVFSYAGYCVVVNSEGGIEVHEVGSAPEP